MKSTRSASVASVKDERGETKRQDFYFEVAQIRKV